MAIKARPADFVVDEELEPAYLEGVSQRVGPYALYALTKRGLTTHEALATLSRRLDVPDADVAAAGLKDKHAVTTQHVTVRIDHRRRLPPPFVESGVFSARQIGFVAEAIGAQAIRANRFRIVLRTLTRRAIDDLHASAERLQIRPAEADARCAIAAETARGMRLRVTNYFGNQRFGSARAGQGFIAAHLIRGEFEQALRLALAVVHRKDLLKVKQFKQALAEQWGNWSGALPSLPRLPERAAVEHLARRPDDFRGAFATLPYFFQQLTVEAYQSLLWNRIAATLLIDELGASERLWVVDDRFGQLVFPEASATPPHLADLDLPVPGRRTVAQSPWQDAAARVLQEEGLSGFEALKIPGLERPWFGESPRKLFMVAERFHLESPEPDEDQPKARRFRITTSFTLPRGGYATVALRALGA